MENKDILTELAKVCDLLEKIPIDSKSQTILMEVSKVEFEKTFDYIQSRYNKQIMMSMDRINSFSINIGSVDIVFNTSNA